MGKKERKKGRAIMIKIINNNKRMNLDGISPKGRCCQAQPVPGLGSVLQT